MSWHEKLIERLIAGDRTGVKGQGLPQEFVRDLVSLVERYTKIEELVVGGVQVSYSPASLEVDLSLSGDVVEQAERLAEAERVRLELPPGPVLELAYVIEDQGIKIIPRQFPESSAGLGGFFFDAELGPNIVLNANVSASEIEYTLARHYGHFLADFDPYITILSGRPALESFEDPVEMRAHQFALAFLMPRSDLVTYREAMGIAPDGSVPLDLVHQLHVYFNLDAKTVIWRLLSLGWLDAAGLQELLSQTHDLTVELQAPSIELPQSVALPERFVRFVAGAFGDGKLELDEAARYLGTDLDETQRILGQFKFEDTSKAKNGNGSTKTHSSEP